VVLTDDGAQQARIADPRHKLAKTYRVQVEGLATDAALRQLSTGVDLGDFRTRPCQASLVPEPPGLWQRNPPVRYRAAIPTSWLEIVLREGKNRQVRRMTAKVGFPTLRLIRWAVGDWTLEGLRPGQWRELDLSGQPDARRRVNVPNASKNRGVIKSLPKLR
jgi:23S rRNA pseudouridine2457 synthase